MTETRTRWEVRLDWSLSAVHWGGLALGVFLSGVNQGTTTSFTLAALLASVYVVSMQALPRRIRHNQVIGEIMAVSGVVVALLAISLTGGIDSAYLFFLAGPSFFAGAFLGFRIGIETAILSSTGLLAVVAALGQEILSGSVFQAMALYTLIAITFSQARRLLVEESARGDALAAASAVTQARMERLETAHNLLTSLSELANAAELNPVSVGEAALRDLALVVPYAAGQVVMNDEDGSIVVARRGTVADPADAEVFALDIAGRDLGRLALWPETGEELSSYRDTVETALRPVALAFDNILILQQIARRAVAEERTRVARDLHDDIGPSLASLGLAIDMAIHQYEPGPSLAVHLEAVRRHVTTLVENIRRTVADLRHQTVASLVDQAHEASAEVGADGPAILVDIDERQPPRTQMANQLGAILTEAIRNAVAHADARAVRLSGTVDRDNGWVTIADDGKGFDPGIEPHDHFGVLGMRERAEKLGASFELDTAPGRGTRVTVSWGDGE